MLKYIYCCKVLALVGDKVGDPNSENLYVELRGREMRF